MAIEIYDVVTNTSYNKDFASYPFYEAKYSDMVPLLCDGPSEVTLPYSPSDESYGIARVIPCFPGSIYTFMVSDMNANGECYISEYPSSDISIVSDESNSLGYINGHVSKDVSIAKWTAKSSGAVLCLLAAALTDGYSNPHACTEDESWTLNVTSDETELDISSDRYYYAAYASGIPYIRSDLFSKTPTLPWSSSSKTNGLCKVITCHAGASYDFTLNSTDTSIGLAVAEYASIDDAKSKANAIGYFPMQSFAYKNIQYPAKSDGILVLMMGNHEATSGDSILQFTDSLVMTVAESLPDLLLKEDVLNSFTIQFRISGAQTVFEFPYENLSLTEPLTEFVVPGGGFLGME